MSGYRLLAESEPTARKAHRCIWCGESIAAGDKYHRVRSFYDGAIQDQAWHQGCKTTAENEYYETGEGEFLAYGNERGTTPATTGAPA